MNSLLFQPKHLVFFWLLVIFGSACTVVKHPKKSTHLTVATYNVHHCNPPGKIGVIDVDGIAKVIKSLQADVVAVQEVDVNTRRVGGVHQAQLLADKAGFSYHYFGKAMNFDGGQYGLLILSKYPISDTQTVALPSANPEKDEPRVLVLATVTLPNGKQFRFGSTHLEAYNDESRILQVNKINRIASETTLPFLVAGDFNAEENSEVIQTLDKTFVRTCQNCPHTFDEDNETGAIDYIAFKKNSPFKVLHHEVIPNNTASDHLPVVAHFNF